MNIEEIESNALSYTLHIAASWIREHQIFDIGAVCNKVTVLSDEIMRPGMCIIAGIVNL